MELGGKRVILLGFGKENQALLPYLLAEKATVIINDQDETIVERFPELAKQAELRLGPEYLNQLQDAKVIFRSPGIPYLTKEIQAARQAGTIITSQTQLFLERCPAQVIGVTGSKGKGTTSTLTATILKQAVAAGELKGKVYLGGNIGLPPISFLPELHPLDWVVLELSSFQLQDLSLSPHIAVVLTVTVDHLDYHRDEAEYINAKKAIVRFQKPSDFAVINQDFVTSLSFAEETPGETFFFSRENSVDKGSFIRRELDDDIIVLRLADQDQNEQTICKTSELQLIGTHSQENVLAAITATAVAGIKPDTIREAVINFQGLPHRLQLVGEKKGVKYYDDSYASMPDATVRAIAAFDRPVTLIVGGSSKKADFDELVAAIPKSKVVRIICIGAEGQRLKQLFQEAGYWQPLLDGGQTMVEIVAQAADITASGEIVLLSPAAASFDMFANMTDRGQQFQEAVAQLPD